MRVLLITNHFPPDVNPSGKLMSQLAEGLRARGFGVDVLTTFPHYEGFKVEREHRGKLLEQEHVGGDIITRVWAFASGRKQNMQHRLANYLSFNALATLQAIRTRRPDVILANSGSFFTGVTASVVRLLRGVPFVYNVQDIYPDVPVRAGQLTNRFAIRNLERIESFMYRRAACISVISREQRVVLLGKGVSDRKLVVIPNFVDTDFIKPLSRDNEFARKHGLTGKFVVAHAGNLGFAYDFDTLLTVAARLQGDPDLLFLIVGEGVRKPDIEQRVRAEGLRNVRLLPFQPESVLPELRAAADVQVALYRTGAALSSLPSKIYEIMASGRPALVAAETGTELRELMEQNACGIAVDPENADQLCDALQRLRAQPAMVAELGQRGRTIAQQQYSRDVATERYAALLQSVASIDKNRHAAQ